MFKKGGFVNPKEDELVIIHPGRVLMCESEFEALKKLHTHSYQGQEIIVISDEKFESMTEVEKMDFLVHAKISNK